MLSSGLGECSVMFFGEAKWLSGRANVAWSCDEATAWRGGVGDGGLARRVGVGDGGVVRYFGVDELVV